MKIIGTGSAHPRLTITNDMLAAFLDTNDEWITTRTGIKQRQIISDERLKDLAIDAAKQAIKKGGIDVHDIDYIICSNVVNEYVTPSLSCIIHDGIDANCPCVDINAACSGFLYGLQIAHSFQRAGIARNILIVCAEEPTRMVDWKDRSTCVLFGDAAGAVLITEGDCMKSMRVTNMSKTDVLYEERKLEPTPYLRRNEDNVPLQMKGQEVFKTAVKASVKDIAHVVEEAGLQIDDIDHFLLHQANLRIIEAVSHLLKQNMSKFPHNVELYGNTSSASIPVLLNEMNMRGELKDGDKIVLSAFGAGFTTGACVIEWHSNQK